MIGFMEAHVSDFGVEPMCRVLQIAPSTWYEHARRKADPDRLPRRVKRDAELSVQIRRVLDENFGVYGVRKVWKQLARDGIAVARCTVARLMKSMGIKGIIRGKPVRTTIPDKAAPCPLDKVNRQFAADRPNKLWVSDFTYVATWSGFVYVAFVIDVYARSIVGWRASRTATAGFVLDALEPALHARRPVHRGRLVHHSDSQRIEASSRASDSHSDGPFGRLAPQDVLERPDPHSDRPSAVSFPGPVGRPGPPCGEVLPRQCL